MLYESPPHTGNQHEPYNDFFNLTATYRLETDFVDLYRGDAKFIWKRNETFNESFDYHATKTKFAAAVISHCRTPSRREAYIKEMQQHASVDVYGGCGPNKCVGNCKIQIAADYKFFLSFENSFCKDYLTEKFHYILNFDIIPVVLGAGNYSHYVSSYN